MKKSDLRADTEYAYSTRRNSPYATRVKLIDADKLYTRSRTDPNTWIPSSRTRYYAGSWNSHTHGLLVQQYNPTAKGYVNEEHRSVVAPQHLLCTWAEWKIRTADREEQQKAASLARIEQETRNQANATRANSLLKERGISGAYASPYSSTVSITVPQLIELLERIPTSNA